jgi:DNA-binding protein HU-beta
MASFFMLLLQINIDKLLNRISIKFESLKASQRFKSSVKNRVAIIQAERSRMNKTELINALSEETLFSKKDLTRILQAMARTIIRALKKGGKFQWSGLGTFSTTFRPEREGINPASKEKIRLKAIFVPKFKAGKLLKEEVRGMVVK